MWAELVAAREEYQGFYRKVIRRHRKKHPSLTVELLLELNGAEDSRPLYRLYRVDLAWKEKGDQFRLAECNLDPISELAPLRRLRTGSLEVIVYPTVWNAVEFRFASRRRSWRGVEEWYMKWLDIDEVKPMDRDGLSEVVHSAGYPTRENGRLSFCVDFGSAPLAAFEELLAALSKAAVTAVEVGSFSHTPTDTDS